MSKDLLINIQDKVKEKQKIDDDIIQDLESIYPNISVKILEVIDRGIVKYIYKPSNRTLWIVLGGNKEYLIYPKLYCGCNDFYKNVVINKTRFFCKHLLAQVICEALNKFKEIELEDSDFKKLIDDLKLKI